MKFNYDVIAQQEAAQQQASQGENEVRDNVSPAYKEPVNQPEEDLVKFMLDFTID